VQNCQNIGQRPVDLSQSDSRWYVAIRASMGTGYLNIILSRIIPIQCDMPIARHRDIGDAQAGSMYGEVRASARKLSVL